MASFRAARPVAFTLLALVASARADFLGKQRGGEAARVAKSPLEESDLLTELEKAVGYDLRAATQARVESLESAVWPLFKALPQQGSGKIGADAVRYVLHRLFVQRHGWFVNGLDNAGGSWNSSSPAAVFQDHAADHHGVFEDKLHKGFGVHQVAVFAAALEALVHSESLERLQAVYRVLGMSQSEKLSDDEGAEAIRAYMVMYTGGANVSSVDASLYKLYNENVYETYPTFADTEKFVKEIRNRVLEDVSTEERNDWNSNLKIVEEVGERYGRWQDKECHVLKGMLMESEQTGTGRVLLEDFYAPNLHNSSWQFVESVPYLRQLGALDETNPEKPTVIIPNYLNSPANCVASSRFYSVCCIDQCEDLLGHLENKIQAPEAAPEEITALVSALPSDTVQAPRELSASLTEKLREIATFHGGRVPLHGRLFAQWMHHAYPRECPYPHVSGTTKPVTQEQWIEEKGEDNLVAGEDEIRAIIAQAKLREGDSKETGPEPTALPWTNEEELFVAHKGVFEVRDAGSQSYAGRGFMLILAPVAALAGLAKYYQPNGKPKGLPVEAASNHKYFV
eukprot:TRINITY_DN2214_c1_g3_i1.p1 TRINITY_DN2214_c1_g3~~TRINITY_DN2214_c1_g3_i1.p1  ORF type:complete len:568 (-),score=157.82 TRINITY_DN2214_c1_g3_i1:103-1806(-)